MAISNQQEWKIIFFLILIIGVMGIIIFQSIYRPIFSCTSVETINASARIEKSDRKIIGLNADTDSLKFGALSPTAASKRVVYFVHSRDAHVKIHMESFENKESMEQEERSGQTSMNLAPLVAIEPKEFFVKASEMKEIRFELQVPENALEGNYSGKAVFCIKE